MTLQYMHTSKLFQNLNNSDSWEKNHNIKQIFTIHFFNTKRHSYCLQHTTHFWSKKDEN